MISSHLTPRKYLPLCVFAVGSLLLTSTQAATARAETTATKRQITCGETALTLDAKTARALKKAKISVAGVKESTSSSTPTPNPCPAKTSGNNRLLFPVTKGTSAQPTLLDSTIEHRNGLRVKFGRKSVLLNTFTIKIDANGKATLAAKVNKGTQLITLIDLNLKSAKSQRKGAVTNVEDIQAKLNSTAAKALNKALGTKVFKRGVVLGKFNTAVTLDTLTIQSGTTTVTVNPTTATALQTLGISLTPIEPATAGASGIVFPVTGGSIGANIAPVRIGHSGGVAFTKGATRLELKNFEIAITADRATISADTGTSRQDILTVTLPSQLPNLTDITPGTTPLNLNGTTLKLTAGAALVLNQVFSTTGFTDGLTLGTADVKLEFQ